MVTMLSLCEINKEFGEVTILKNINLDITLGERVGLVGLNGAGKSTLANIIYGSLKPDGGSILWHKKDIDIGYLHQDSFYEQRTWRGDIVDSKGKINIKDFSKISSYLGMDKVLSWEEERFNNLSGGEKMKLALASIWSLNPDFIILDEPTNHMDYQGMQWLIEELNRYKGTILVISHDRYFLDKTVKKIIEISDGISDIYYGNYSFYREEKKRRYESQLHEYEIQESNKAKIQEEISRLKNWSQKAHRDSTRKQAAGLGKKEYFRMKAKKKDRQIKSKIKKLEKIDLNGIQKPKEDRKINFTFNEADVKGIRVLEAVDIKKSFGSRNLFEKSCFYILRGEKVGVFGPNGCGKTTLLKILLGKEVLDEGELFISKSIDIGYLSQESRYIDGKQSVLELFDTTSREEESRIRTLLANMGFNEKMIKSPLSTLSLGELTRVRMAKLIAKQQELLVLDEPLNHLDIYSREKLEEALKEYNGTIILVSHDRYMIENICHCLLVFEEGKINKVIDSPKEYLDRLTNKNPSINPASKKKSLKQIKEEKMMIENEIAYVLGQLSTLSEESPEYEAMDKRFKELIDLKRSELLS